MTQATLPTTGTIAPGMRYEFLHDGKIICFKIDTHEHHSADALYDFASNLIENWAADKPYLVLYEVTSSKVLLTGYARHKFMAFQKKRPELKGRAAVIIFNNVILGHLVRILIMTMPKRGRDKRIFTTREAALQWLVEGIK